MAVIFDEVRAEVAPQRPAVEETARPEQATPQLRLKRDILQSIERRRRRERRLSAD
jgi:hypothetical protein